MDRLSSCYFCGDALDASLDEYPVVPSELGPPADAQRTVVLCRSCHRKLGSVLDAVVDAVGDDPARGAGEQPIQSSLDGGEDVLRSVTDGDEGDETDDPPVGEAVDEGTVPDDESGSSDSTAIDEGEPSDIGPDTDPDGGEETGNGGTDHPPGDGTDHPSDSRTGPETTLTRLEYNKVMRLLQNREFPVKRAGFVNVAANAYELPRRDCERILDMAIENGLIDEEDGQLVKPGE